MEGRSDIRPVTAAKYQHMLERHVAPVLEDYELATLSPSAVRSWCMAMRKRYLTTDVDAYQMLRAIPALEAWLFPTEDGGPMVPSTLNRAWQRGEARQRPAAPCWGEGADAAFLR